MQNPNLRQGATWSAEEDRKLYDLTISRTPLSQICEEHDRSKGAITSRQKRLGLRDKHNSQLLDPPPPFKTYARPKSKIGPESAAPNLGSAKKRNVDRPPEPRWLNIDKQELAVLIQQTPDTVERIWIAIERDIKELFEQKKGDLSDRDTHVSIARLSPGEHYHEHPTLQELGDAYGVTRERIRQICEKTNRQLNTRIKARRGWTHGVLRDIRASRENLEPAQFYAAFLKELIDSETKGPFTTFVMKAMARMEGLSHPEVAQIEDRLRIVFADEKRELRAAEESRNKIRRKQKRADRTVTTVLRKAIFSGTFAAEGLRVLDLPRLRSCSGSRELYSKTLGRFVQWDSNAERRFIWALDHSSIINEFAEQPIQIEYLHEGKIRKYIVDLMVKTIEDVSVAIEIKCPVMLADSFVRAKARAAETALGKLGIGYCLVDVDGRSTDDILNVEPTEELKGFLRETLRARGMVTMPDLRAHLGRWPSQYVSDQIQSLVLKHDLDYRVVLLPNRKTGKISGNYTFTLKL